MAEKRTRASRCPLYRASTCQLKEDGVNCSKTEATDAMIALCALQIGGLDLNPVQTRPPKQQHRDEQ